MARYRGSRSRIYDVYPDDPADWPRWSSISSLGGTTTTVSAGESIIIACSPASLPPGVTGGLARAYVLINARGAGVFSVSSGWNLGAAEGYSGDGGADDWYVNPPYGRTPSLLKSLTITTPILTEHFVVIPNFQEVYDRNISANDILLVQLRCVSGSVDIDYVAYQEEAADGWFFPSGTHLTDWNPEYVVPQMEMTGFLNGGTVDNKFIRLETSEDNVASGGGVVPLHISDWDRMLANAEAFDTNVGSLNFDDHSAPNTGDTAHWAVWSHAMVWTYWDVLSLISIFEFTTDNLAAHPLWDSWSDGYIADYYRNPWWVAPSILGIDDVVGEITYENVFTEVLFDTTIVHPAAPVLFGDGGSGAYHAILNKDIKAPNGPYRALDFQSGINHSDLGGPSFAWGSDFPLTNWATTVIPAYGDVPAYTIGQAWLGGAFDADMSSTHPEPGSTDPNPTPGGFIGAGILGSSYGERLASLSIHSATVDVRFPRWRLTIQDWVKGTGPTKVGIPPMRQRHRDDGLATDARQMKGHGSSLQSSIRRGGQVYY